MFFTDFNFCSYKIELLKTQPQSISDIIEWKDFASFCIRNKKQTLPVHLKF
jgi:hypothetical protein